MAGQREVVKLEGLADLKANLAALGDEVATKVGQRANNRAALVGAKAVRAAAPVSDIPSGAKRSRINKGRKKGVGKRGPYRVEYEHHKIRDEIKVRKVRAKKEHLVITAITTGKAFQSRFVELGTRKMGAKPFMRPAIDANAGKMREAQIDELRKGIERQARRSKIGKKT